MDCKSVLLILGAVALYAIWRWVKNRERRDLEDLATDQAPTEPARDPIGFHLPKVTE
ncbi:MAG TPA: hypothetical protein H9899_07520 [Candidatus Sphingomonas excrementigallinarum]|nr:hypothetical protein [Candidatus Sphingomonas excrementigallinarum]